MLRTGLLVAVLLVLVSCASPSPESPEPSPAAASPADTAACEPIDLRTPAGQPIDLTGVWAPRPPEVGFFVGSSEMTWIRQVGDCLWAVIMDGEFRADPNFAGTFEHLGGNLGTFAGTVDSDFTITGDLVAVRWGNPLHTSNVVPMTLQIAFGSDGTIQLREVRDPTEFGPRCYSTDYCPTPVVLYREEDLSGNLTGHRAR